MEMLRPSPRGPILLPLRADPLPMVTIARPAIEIPPPRVSA